MSHKAPNPPPPEGVKRPAPPPAPPESPQEKHRRKAAERKARQRQREAALDMKPWGGSFSSGERARIAAGALASGFDDQTEYLFSLVRQDTKGMEI